MNDTARAPQVSQTLEELEAIMRDALVACGERPARAEIVAARAAEEVRRIYGGEMLYIPMGLGYKTARRNTEIRRRVEAGENPNVLRREFELSKMQMGRIVGPRRKK